METSRTPDEPKADVEKILSDFDRVEDLLTDFCERTRGLIEASLQDANIRYQSVQTRVKGKKKLRDKYLDPAKSYKALQDITDLAGLRIITYYEGDIDQVAGIIKREVDIDSANSIDKRDADPDRFGYSALNYVCQHLAKRASDVEYKKFAGIKCEIQITSILRHAWSEIEHEWYDLKGAYPDKIKRRFYRIAALLELAESEFLDIRRRRTEYERSVVVRVEAKVPDIPIDAVSLRPFIEQEPLVRELDTSIAMSFSGTTTDEVSDKIVESRAKSANLVGITNLQDLRRLLDKYKGGIPEFVDRCQKEIWREPRPSGPAPLGLCIYHLALLLVSSRGKEELGKFLTELGLRNIDWERISLQVPLAQKILAKY